MWFGLAAIALVGAVALLYIDRSRRDELGRVRQGWAKAQGYTYTAYDDDIVSKFRRAALAKPEHTTALDLVRGVRRGEKFVLFDVEETSTIVAVQRPVGSDVDIDLRLKSTPPPRDPDMELLGSIGPRVVFATEVEVARRVCDQRMVAFTESVPTNVSLLWSENDWTLGALPLGSTGRDWDGAIDAVARLSGMLHVLPPAARRPAGGTRGEAPQRRRDDRPAYGARTDSPPTDMRRESSETARRSDTARPDLPRTEANPSARPGPNRAVPGARPGPRPPSASRDAPNRPTPINREADRRSTES
ncbi:hypothetical protein QMK17_08360 [Rhodococcus sp. G-MC3]|uniref:hypothetical protein n=1 Tax=Rhodococcus sp. G-MC3 TaxID=3046209 RepID=UPI0024B87E37|nr:hypothetical protein [Rhodococcus sp. G-MC3]MDJ0393344.1 hypothetical protein [Rhodococcus sp. G-MC3]